MEKDATEQRLEAILQGAFAGPPTPLKDIPTRNGKRRKLEASNLSVVVASARSAPPET